MRLIHHDFRLNAKLHYHWEITKCLWHKINFLLCYPLFGNEYHYAMLVISIKLHQKGKMSKKLYLFN